MRAATDDAWMVDAACAGLDPDLFFPERGQNATPAKAVCRTCPVRLQCLEYAFVHHVTYGVFGGLTEKERRRVRQQRRRNAAA